MNELPDKLYKFRALGGSASRTAAIVKDCEIWFSKPSEFNDPFDCNLYVPYRLQRGELGERLLKKFWPEDDDAPENPAEIIKAAGRGEKVDPAELKKARKSFLIGLGTALLRAGNLRVSASSPEGTIDINAQVDQSRQERLKRVIDTLDNSIGVLSLSAARNSILLWSHYAQNHHGVALEFDREKLDAEFPQLRAVRYGEMPEVSAKFPALMEKIWRLAPEMPHRLVIAMANMLSAGPPGKDLEAEFDEAMDSELCYLVDWFYTKHDDWAYEQEWRALAPRNGLVKFPPEALSGIIIGCAASSDTLDTVRKWVANAQSPVTIYIAQRVEGKFALDIVPAPGQ